MDTEESRGHRGQGGVRIPSGWVGQGVGLGWIKVPAMFVSKCFEKMSQQYLCFLTLLFRT